ncbi:hypothetical protein [Ferruginibacter sp. SUN106]|uniref:hypothetical protein n=1 Tax=Ferruginibacter sp. SUN106 TaxID=2978348 RepID=UPI003D367EBE
MKQLLLKVTFILIQFCFFTQVKSQDASQIDRYQSDTLRLFEKTFTKTVAYQYHSIVFYVDYVSFKQVVVDRLKGYQPYRKSTYEATLKKLNSDITKSDTVYLTQNTFDSVEIIPFDRYLIEQIETNNCVVKDLNNNTQTEIIRVKETRYYRPGIWGGRTYYIKGDKNFFIQLTDIVS